jgi:hypothetical protein
VINQVPQMKNWRKFITTRRNLRLTGAAPLCRLPVVARR